MSRSREQVEARCAGVVVSVDEDGAHPVGDCAETVWWRVESTDEPEPAFACDADLVDVLLDREGTSGQVTWLGHHDEPPRPVITPPTEQWAAGEEPF